MANFASESDVRLALQANDTVAVPSALVEASIAAAHDDVLRRVDPALIAGTLPVAVIRGEAWLAGAYLLRSLAAKDAVDRKQVTIGNQRIEAGTRCSTLTTIADLAEAQAWGMLAPYLTDGPARESSAATDTVAVLSVR